MSFKLGNVFAILSDQIAIPDFGSGAMENWGLVMYSEPALLYNPAVSSNEDKEWVASVISHELAHMVLHLTSAPSETRILNKATFTWDMGWRETERLSVSGSETW